jgi:hypothetical protein
MRASLLLALVLLVAAPTTIARAESEHGYLWQCIAITREEARFRCYTRLLLERVERSRDPARELPRIDREVEDTGGELVGACHGVMHEVGRRYGRAHGVTLATLRRYIPRSSNPRCSAGFGMGLVMYLGPELVRSGGRGALADCQGLPTRFRAYTCIHGLGHALMRGWHGRLAPAVRACRSLGRHGVDCSQGAFHDYWISLRGADDTTRPRNAITSPRLICDGRYFYVRPCWYRYFIEQQQGERLETAADIERTCRGLRPLQRAGCVGGASLALSTDPFAQTNVCASLAGRDVLPCLRGVVVPAVIGDTERQQRLLARCARFRRGASACWSWLGRTLTLVTDGAFAHRCGEAPSRAARAACRSGAARVEAPLVTFS